MTSMICWTIFTHNSHPDLQLYITNNSFACCTMCIDNDHRASMMKIIIMNFYFFIILFYSINFSSLIWSVIDIMVMWIVSQVWKCFWLMKLSFSMCKQSKVKYRWCYYYLKSCKNLIISLQIFKIKAVLKCYLKHNWYFQNC